MQFASKIIMHSRLIVWKFICDGCKAQAEVYVAYNSAMKHPTGWGWHADYSTASSKPLYAPTMLDYCPVCVEKKEIREVFK